MTIPPPADVLLALGHMTLKFAELECWIYMGIIEGCHIEDASEQEKVAKCGFSARVRHLDEAVRHAQDRDWIRPGEGTTPKLDFVPDQLAEIGYERNALIHGEGFTLINVNTGIVRHCKVNSRFGRQRSLDKQTLDALTGKIENYAEQLQLAVMNLGLSKKAQGIGSLTML